jgi:uncharacterized membrane protein YfcA
MISTPLLALVIGPIAAAGVIFPILIVQDGIAVAMYRRTFNWQILATMIPGAALGVCSVYVLASAVPGWSVEIVLGVVSLAFSLQQISASSTCLFNSLRKITLDGSVCSAALGQGLRA